jgi:hypothetical protein
MESKILIFLGLLEAASVAHASCAYGTSLHPRAEGAVEINDFGYTGAIVSPPYCLSHRTSHSYMM